MLMAGAAIAQEDGCIDFGFDNAYLQAHFCKELRRLGENGLGTRSAVSGDDSTQQAGDIPPWAELPVLQDAYRADPSATLELIQRIKSAGGGLEVLQ